MDPDKAAFLFGEIHEGFDVDDPDDRAELVALDHAEALADVRSEIRAMIAEQIVSENPPYVWATAQRLLALGVERREVMTELALALTHAAKESLAGRGLDDGADEQALGWLPLPAADQVEAAALDLVRSGETVAATDLERLVLERLGRSQGDPLSEMVVDRVLDRLLDDDEGPLALLVGDRVVHVGDLTEGIVLTHHLSASERELDVLTAGFDLAGYSRRSSLHLPDGSELLVFSAEAGHLGWHGPPGWLSAYPPGTLLAVRVDRDGLVSLQMLVEEPELDPALVALLRSVYDEEVAEPWLPVRGEDLVLAALAADPKAFAEPRPPLAVLCEAAGLERRRDEVGHEESVWEAQVQLRRMHRVFDALAADEQRRAAARVLELAETDEEAPPEDLRRALADLADPDVAEVVLEELVDMGQATRLGETLVAVAATPRQVGVARWVAGVAAERAGEVLVAEAHLQLALEADLSSAPVVERCAWYASDRGDAARAVRLWRQLRTDRSDDLTTVEPFARRSGPKLGRNDPCWCGSGRKHKTCHRDRVPAPPLPERVGWLCRKATAYLEHAGREGRDLVRTLAAYRAVELTEEGLLEALDDPIVIDAALTEGGWFARFVEDRGCLLPDDEALLAHSWMLVARTVYEVLEVRPGEGLRVRDLRTGDVLDVRERTYSRQARAQALVCGRAVPAGETHQFVGALFPVAPGTERGVLALCEEGDPEALCEYVASLHRPPVLQTREGEPLVACRAVLEVADRAEAQRVLDRHYRREGEGWVEMHAISDDEEILRATLSLEGSLLEVATHSGPRLDRVLNLLADVLPGARVLSEERQPLAPGQLPAPPNLPGSEVALDAAAVAQIQDLLERRWLDESVPALGGLTPREAADDPTHREELVRLIASFPSPQSLGGRQLAMRPARLRELLGL